MSFELIDAGTLRAVDATLAGGRVFLSAADVERATGWALKSEGLCRDTVCVPVRDRAALVGAAGVDLAAFAAAFGRPLALDLAEGVAALGTAAADRSAALTSLEAPDFSLPDLAGRRHTLSDHRGRKALLIAYASW